MGSQITASLAILILSTQAAVQVAAYAQYGGQNWTGATTATSSKPPTTITTSTTSKATTTTQAPGGGGGIVTPTKVTTTFPSTISETMLPSATVISGVFDDKWHAGTEPQQMSVKARQKPASKTRSSFSKMVPLSPMSSSVKTRSKVSTAVALARLSMSGMKRSARMR
ncbi:hypothetical protein ACEPPN_005986 [Leptodophora sp. 'Broadleaf-Isolate-01']